MRGALRHLSSATSSSRTPRRHIVPRHFSSVSSSSSSSASSSSSSASSFSSSSSSASSSSSSSEEDLYPSSDGLSEIRSRIVLQTEKPSRSPQIPEYLRSTISFLASQLLSSSDLCFDSPPVSSLLSSLLSSSPNGTAFLELLSHLRSRPLLALQVFTWRMEQVAHPMLPEEYAKAIALAGRARRCDIAFSLFRDATARGLRTVSTYNSLMAAYLYNGDINKALAVFDHLKRDSTCNPTIVTYNILLSLFGRSNLVDHMEEILRVIRNSDLHFNTSTYNNLIVGYLIVAKWDKMEAIFREMEEGSHLKPDLYTYSLMLRGFANAGYVEKMERFYGLASEQIHKSEFRLFRTMIWAYCRSSDPDRVRKIEKFLGYMPEREYLPWLNVMLIRLYAEEGLVEKMESSIREAFDHHTVVTGVSIMKSIITSYYRCDAVDKLAEFVQQAELAGWRLCRSVYHCKMVMYGRQRRYLDMLGVLEEMETVKLEPCKKTFCIMYYAHNFGETSYADGVLGLMYKNGFESRANALSRCWSDKGNHHPVSPDLFSWSSLGVILL